MHYLISLPKFGTNCFSVEHSCITKQGHRVQSDALRTNAVLIHNSHQYICQFSWKYRRPFVCCNVLTNVSEPTCIFPHAARHAFHSDLNTRRTKCCVHRSSDQHPYQWSKENRKTGPVSCISFLVCFRFLDVSFHTLAFSCPWSKLWSLSFLASDEVWPSASDSIIFVFSSQRQECQDRSNWTRPGSCWKRPPSDHCLPDKGKERGENFSKRHIRTISDYKFIINLWRSFGT